MRTSVITLPSCLALLLLLLAGLAGCGSSSGIEKVVVGGNVTFEEELVGNGEIRFYPTEGTRGPVSGGPIKDGRYITQGRGGVPVGTHLVDIRAFRPDPRYKGHPEGGPVTQYLPEKYNANTTLVVTVSQQESTHDFALSSD